MMDTFTYINNKFNNDFGKKKRSREVKGTDFQSIGLRYPAVKAEEKRESQAFREITGELKFYGKTV